MKIQTFLAIAWLAAVQASATEANPGSKSLKTAHETLNPVVIPSFEVSASSIYDAVNQTLSMAAKQEPRVAELQIVIGPMAARARDLPQKLGPLKNERLLTILRYWAEMYEFRFTTNGQKVVFDEDFTEDFAVVTPSTLFSKSFWSGYRVLGLSGLHPLDVVQKIEDCEEVVRIFTWGGWGGNWSVTICGGLATEGPDDYPYRRTGFTICYQHSLYLGESQAEVVHRKALDAKTGARFMGKKVLQELGSVDRTDFDLGPAHATDVPQLIIEVLNKSGYHFVVRTHGGYEFGDLLGDGRGLAESVFKGELKELEDLEKKSHEPPVTK